MKKTANIREQESIPVGMRTACLLTVGVCPGGGGCVQVVYVSR